MKCLETSPDSKRVDEYLQCQTLVHFQMNSVNNLFLGTGKKGQQLESLAALSKD